MKCWFAKLTSLLLLLAALPLAAQDLSSYEKRVSVKTLPNGLTVVLWRRPEAPVFSFFTLVDAGSAQDPRNETGLAHMMEHMAFKGTPDIGTTDYAAEKPALEKVEQTYAAYEAERIKRVGQDPQKLAQLKAAWEQAMKDAEQVRRAEPIRRDRGEPRWRGRQRLHQLRRNRLHVLDAVEHDRAVGGAGVRPVDASGDARVLQGAQRGDGRAPHAHRQPANGTTGRAVSGHGLHGEPLPSARPSVMLPICKAFPPPMRPSSSSGITCPATW